MSIDNILKLVRSGDLDITEAKRLLEEQQSSAQHSAQRTSREAPLPRENSSAPASSEAEAQGIDDTLGYAQLDLHRAKRTGFPEVIFGEGKTAEQIASIFERLMAHSDRVLATRVSPDKAAYVLEHVPGAVHHAAARALTWTREDAVAADDGYIAVVCAGTSDVPVAEEAAVTAECMGVRAERIYDVGVAGIHRLFRRLPLIRGAKAIVVVAGMEGALASVMGGLVSVPLIAVPTSIGYGANFQGLAALLAMLNSCAPGISVVNIDNGFGAGYNAALIYKNSK